MLEKKKIPVGLESFEQIRRENFYYVDKTGLIRELLENWGQVNLFTRPRRFGKSLNMSMLQSFFELGCDPQLFDGLSISKDNGLCKEYMGKFPVVFVSLKDIDAGDYKTARGMLIKVVNQKARRLQYLLDSEKLSIYDKKIFAALLEQELDDETLYFSLRELTELLNKHFCRKAILLIDEYDVPLAKANEQGYYREMTALIRSLFSAALKTNENLYFAVLTGCLRVAKESIFTGLNNMNIFSITDGDLDEYFGFTDREVREMLQYYGLEENYETVKEWYDGYRFGKAEVYCPWDVVCYCSKHRKNKKLPPQNYWINTSGNEVLRHFISGMASQRMVTKAQMERLVEGETVQKEIYQELTYPELYASSDNLWSTLFMTGYLTQRGEPDGNLFHLAIPNREVRNIFTEQILKMFQEAAGRDGEALGAFCNALEYGRAGEVERRLTGYLEKTISIRDTFARKPTKENFYHGILLGILGFKDGWTVSSNREAGDGFSDIMIQTENMERAILIEVKYAEDNLDAVCQKALKQIEEKRYGERMHQDGVQCILKYGIACSRKHCRVLLKEETMG